MEKIPDTFYDDFIRTAHLIGNGYALCSSGNLSLRVDGHRCLISQTGSWLGKITKEQIAVCDYTTGEPLNGLRPSCEFNFHFGILNARKDVNVVMHTQPMFATTIACSKSRPSSYEVTAEIPCYIGRVAEVPYTRPGSKELAELVTAALREHQVVLLLNHGIVTVGSTTDEAYQRTCFFEMASRIILETRGDYTLLGAQDLCDIDHYILGKQ